MKALTHLGLMIFLADFQCLAQAAPQPSSVGVDLNGDSKVELHYDIEATRRQSFPPIWDVGSGVWPSSGAKFLRAQSERFGFRVGESIGSTAAVFETILPEGIAYGFGALGYFLFESQENPYRDNGGQALLMNEKDFLLGVRLVGEDGTHYGWVRFSRPVLDNHTLFEIVGHDWNPIPGAPIPAGEPPGPPPVQATVANDGGLNFTWDNRLGKMVLEWAGSLESTTVWQSVPESGFSPVSLPISAGHRFFRVRRP